MVVTLQCGFPYLLNLFLYELTLPPSFENPKGKQNPARMVSYSLTSCLPTYTRSAASQSRRIKDVANKAVEVIVVRGHL